MAVDALKKVDVLIEALPYIKAFHNRIVVVKYGGSGLSDKPRRRQILEDIIFMRYVGMRPVLLHGGGPLINERISKSGKKSKFVAGLRVTDSETISVVDEVLAEINKTIAEELQNLGAEAVSLCDEECRIIKTEKVVTNPDIGYVGNVVFVDTKPIHRLVEKGRIPVISPIGIGDDKLLYNVNADEAASKIASHLQAEELMLLTNTRGIMRDEEDETTFIPTLTKKEAKDLVEKKVIHSGMIPKINACIAALEAGVKKAHILDSRLEHSLLLEIFTDAGVGTEIVKDKRK